MEAYTSFAKVYDTFMDNVPYEEWAEYLAELLQEYDIEDGLVLDLGGGTGSLTEILATKGYDMIGAGWISRDVGNCHGEESTEWS